MTRYPGAAWLAGPAWKSWGQTNAGAGIVLHSMEGYEYGAWSVLNGSSNASWHFSVMQDGRVYQHYELRESCWHAGSKQSNERYIGIEHEGVAGEPFTSEQTSASVNLVRWLAEQLGVSIEQGRTVIEHRNAPGASTTCPNGRIPWSAYMPADVQKKVNQEAFDLIVAVSSSASVVAAQVDGQYVGILPGAPAGYRDVVVRLRST